MASKQPWRSNLKSDLKFMAQTTYATMFVRTDLAFFCIILERRRRRKFVSTRPVGFAPGKNNVKYGKQRKMWSAIFHAVTIFHAHLLY